MSKIWIQEVSKTSKIEILGHIFNGLKEIKDAVEAYCRVEREPWNSEPSTPIEGIHIICVYERYPCFDSYDYANEDRNFSNYFFSTEPFTKQQIERLAKLPGRYNAQIVNGDMPEWATPAVYYRGEGDEMVVATHKTGIDHSIKTIIKQDIKMKQRIFNLIILDESGSMSSIEKQAITGVNETVQTIREAQKKHEEQEHYVTLVSFNSGAVKTIYDKVEALKVEELTDQQYVPSCCTPLYDAMGNALTSLKKSVEQDDKVLVTIITDGYENASSEYNGPAIKSLVESLKSRGWVFTYIGANQNVEKVAATISITNTLNFCATDHGTSAMFMTEKKSRSRWFDRLSAGASDEELADNYFSEE